MQSVLPATETMSKLGLPSVLFRVDSCDFVDRL
jgi:hypothetical protein